MSFTSDVSIEKSPHRKDGRIARLFLPPAGVGYPNLYLEIHYRVDLKSSLVNPLTKDTDFRVLVSPYGYNLSEAFNAPAHGVQKDVHGPLVDFSFVYTVTVGGQVDAEISIKEIFTIKKEIKGYTGVVLITGKFNTKNGASEIRCDKH